MSWSPALPKPRRLVVLAPVRLPLFPSRFSLLSPRFAHSTAQLLKRPRQSPPTLTPSKSKPHLTFSPSPVASSQKKKQKVSQFHELYRGCPDPSDMSIKYDWEYIFEALSPPMLLNESVYNQPEVHLDKAFRRSHRRDVKTEKKTYTVDGRTVHRVVLSSPSLDIRSIGDEETLYVATKLAQLSFVFQLLTRGIITVNTGSTRTVDNVPAWLKNLARTRLVSQYANEQECILSDGTDISVGRSRIFFDYYCARYGLPRPEIKASVFERGISLWQAVLKVGESVLGNGKALSKKHAEDAALRDGVKYLEKQDSGLWQSFLQAEKDGTVLGFAPRMPLTMSRSTERELVDLCRDISQSILYKNAPDVATEVLPSMESEAVSATDTVKRNAWKSHSPTFLNTKSERLKAKLDTYREDPKYATMRAQRESLPVMSRKQDVLDNVSANDVSICMAATGSGKTTQIPQILLDDAIDRGEGAKCNIVCTQPRRIAAISVAQRVANERGETIGQHSSIGYQVRFESALPEQHGSVTFCTTGILLKRLQSYFKGENSGDGRDLDLVSHIVVDEVHERDVDTDLLLVVLKRLLQFRRERNLPIKIVLMSATIDPTLFQEYFKDQQGLPAPMFEIPGRSYPVDKHFLDEFIHDVVDSSAKWVFEDKNTSRYLKRELLPQQVPAPLVPILRDVKHRSMADDMDDSVDDLDIPYPLVAATIAHVLSMSDNGHVLVFLPGWEEIQSVNRILTDPMKRLRGINFSDRGKYHIHMLHSTIPVLEQQQVFEPPPEGVRRIILSTNIAETSVTIPNVVYVVDTAKTKENRYDPSKHMTSLVSSWVGSSNLNQRAGRAGRHRSGEYFGLITQSRYAQLQPHQTVEMKRADLSNVVMHIKALHFPNMAVQDVLAAAIEPPDPERVEVAMNNLKMTGALDVNDELTSLGRVLLHIPVDVQLGLLVLYGCFFRCLSRALTLAAILSNRDPFVSPPLLKQEAYAAKMSWLPPGSNSDVLATVAAYEAWAHLYNARDFQAASKFCLDNFLSRPTLILIHKIRGQLLHSLYTAGVIDVSAGGTLSGTELDKEVVPAALNTNAPSLPLLSSLIAIASQPKFAVRLGQKPLRTTRDKVVIMHPSGVNAPSPNDTFDRSCPPELYAFLEKRQNISVGASGQTYLVGTTRLEPLPYILFGAHHLELTRRGLECDKWILFGGDYDTFADIQMLRTRIDACMRRVFEGISRAPRQKPGSYGTFTGRTRKYVDEEELVAERDYGEDNLNSRGHRLSNTEVQELDFLTRDVVHLLDRHSAEIRRPSRDLSRRPEGQHRFRPRPRTA